MAWSWTVVIVSALAVATLVALWRPTLALLLAGPAALAFFASFAFTINHWGECEEGCSGTERVFGWVNSFFLCLAFSLVLAGGVALAATRDGRDTKS
jgi:hypothetical protein